VVPLGASDRSTRRQKGLKDIGMDFATLPIAPDSRIDGTLSPAVIAALNGCSFAAFTRTRPWSCIIEQSEHWPRQALQQLAVGPGTREHANPEQNAQEKSG
jgi:hypothetical protein